MMLLLFVSFKGVFAVGIGISPGSVVVVDVLAGGKSTIEFLLSSTSSDPMYVEVTPEGDLAPFVRVSMADGVLQDANPLAMKLAISPPSDFPEGISVLRLTVSANIVAPLQNLSAALVPVVQAEIVVNVSSEKRADCVVGGLQVFDVEEGERLSFSFLVQNRGNVRIFARAKYTLWNGEKTVAELAQEESIAQVLPGDVQFIDHVFPTPLREGEFVLDVQVPLCNASIMREVVVKSKGSITDKGILQEVVGKNISAGALLPLQAIFRNTGGRQEVAQAVFRIYEDDILVRIEKSESVLVNPGDEVELLAYFRPGQEGEFLVVSTVVYNARMTEEMSTKFVVGPIEQAQPRSEGGGGSAVLFISIFACIVFLVFLIVRKKRRLR
jgi:hypothetical protein